jgi:galactokinase/galacturonokinase
MVFRPTDDGAVVVNSLNYPGSVRFNIADEHFEREYFWGDFVKGAVYTLRKKFALKRGFVGLVKGSLPTGGLSSSAAVILTYLNALCKVNELHLTRNEMIQQALREEKGYIGVNVGKLDQSCEVYCKKDHLLYLDTKDDTVKLISAQESIPRFEIAVIFSGVERKLAGSAYNTRVDECKAAAYAMQAYAGMEYGKFENAFLRDVPQSIFEEYKSELPRNWYKRAKHYYSEIERVKKGVEVWQRGDLSAFGQLIFESGYSSINYYETGSEELKTLYNIMLKTDGIYGGRFSGAGFNGSSMALVNPDKKEEIAMRIEERYIQKFPQLKGKMSIHFCNTADGLKLD